MPYCPRCGVEVENHLDKCPLCDTAIPNEVRNLNLPEASYPEDLVPPQKMYKSLTSRQKKRLIFSLIVLMAFLPILLTSVLDFIQNGTLSWSYYVTFSILGASGIASLYIRFPRNPIVPLNGTVVILMLLYLLLRKYSLPAFISSKDFALFVCIGIVTDCFLVFLRSSHRRWYNIVSYSLLILTLFLTALEFILSGAIKWSLITSSALIPFMVYFYYLGRAKHKGLNSVGFLFLLLTLMLIALDFSTDFSGWSLITSVISGSLALFFYILHIALFNDTDWKKALHL